MQKKMNKKLLSLILSMMLIVAMAFSMTACGDNNTNKEDPVGTEGQIQAGETESDVQSESDAQTGSAVLGEGATVFTFVVVDGEGNETTFEIHTDKTTVGEALLEVELIDGEDSEYGLYVKSVNGIVADYNVDGTYWAFYINGEMAMSGVDTTDIEEGATYSFKVEK